MVNIFKRKKKLPAESEKFIKEQVKEFTKRVTEYDERMHSLCSKNLDYIFLREIFEDVCKHEPGFTVEITLADGTKLEAYVKKEPQKTNKWS